MWCAHLYKEVVIKVEILQDWYLEDDGGTKKPGTLCVPGLSFLLSYTFPQIDPRQNILYRLVGYRLHLVPHTLCHQGSHNIFVLRYQIRLFSFRLYCAYNGIIDINIHLYSYSSKAAENECFRRILRCHAGRYFQDVRGKMANSRISTLKNRTACN